MHLRLKLIIFTNCFLLFQSNAFAQETLIEQEEIAEQKEEQEESLKQKQEIVRINGYWKFLNQYYKKDIINKPLVNGVFDNRIYYTDDFKSDNYKEQNSEAIWRSRLDLSLNITDDLTIAAAGQVDEMNQYSENTARSNSPNGGGDRSFENEGAFLDELILNYNYKDFSVLAGKFTANFGYAWSFNNGIWINEINKQYKQSEKLGFGVIQRFGDRKEFGQYVFGASVFTSDRKNFDNSIITRRDEVSKSSGTPSDTRGLNSYVLSADILYEFNNNEKLSYHFSYLNSAINTRNNTSNTKDKIADEKAFAININYDYPINENFVLKSFGEYVEINNVGGNVEEDSKFFSVNFTAEFYKNFSMVFGKSKEKEFKVATNGIDKSISEIDLGYKFINSNPFLNGTKIMIGYKMQDNDQKTIRTQSESFGVFVNHKIEF